MNANNDNEYYRSDGVKILHDPFAPGLASKYGLPGETEESVQASIDLCQRVQPDRVQFTRFTPIPGSKLADLVSHDPTSFHDRSRNDQVEEWLQKCYRECQFKPSV